MKLTIKEIGQEGQSKTFNVPDKFLKDDKYKQDKMLGEAGQVAQESNLANQWGNVLEIKKSQDGSEDEATIYIPEEGLVAATHHLQHILWSISPTDLAKIGFEKNMKVVGDEDIPREDNFQTGEGDPTEGDDQIGEGNYTQNSFPIDGDDHSDDSDYTQRSFPIDGDDPAEGDDQIGEGNYTQRSFPIDGDDPAEGDDQIGEGNQGEEGDQGESEGGYNLRVFDTVSIWFSTQPDQWIRANDKELIKERAQKAEQKGGKTSLVYSGNMLNEQAQTDLNEYCRKNKIQAIDFDKLSLKNMNKDDIKLYKLAKLELNYSNQRGGNVAAASDLVRWITPIISEGIYIDIDIKPNFDEAPNEATESKKLKVNSPILFNMGSTIDDHPSQRNLLLEKVGINTDMIGVCDQINGDEAQKLLKAIKSEIITRYEYAMNVFQWEGVTLLTNSEGYNSIAKSDKKNPLFSLRKEVTNVKNWDNVKTFMGNQWSQEEQDKFNNKSDEWKRNIFRPLVTQISGPFAVSTAVLHGWPPTEETSKSHLLFNKQDSSFLRTTMRKLQESCSFYAVNEGKMYHSDNIPNWNESNQTLLQRAQNLEGLSWIPNQKDEQKGEQDQPSDPKKGKKKQSQKTGTAKRIKPSDPKKGKNKQSKTTGTAQGILKKTSPSRQNQPNNDSVKQRQILAEKKHINRLKRKKQ
ncbi:hypothetical protein BJP34_03055 [Moorena producens PAL-8-15-08-1]|uniref:Lgt1 glycosyltransferase domain-containing protein n=1 Tax=Moorena producens PAL-8-15-08-1 TaxID=1458985 RepID=A0A1D8TLM6_9CYAN|nr:glycosyltransferase family 88 protein [Moorena producens]AOW98560.1 hypothetical protein BJP34_03055 [Moorena producens PAL-8-15-08-1]